MVVLLLDRPGLHACPRRRVYAPCRYRSCHLAPAMLRSALGTTDIVPGSSRPRSVSAGVLRRAGRAGRGPAPEAKPRSRPPPRWSAASPRPLCHLDILGAGWIAASTISRRPIPTARNIQSGYGDRIRGVQQVHTHGMCIAPVDRKARTDRDGGRRRQAVARFDPSPRVPRRCRGHGSNPRSA